MSDDYRSELTAAQVDRVLEELRAGRRLAAIVFVRESLGVGLDEALARVAQVEARQVGHPREAMDELEVVATGAYSGGIADCLDYTQERYLGTPVGALVVATLPLGGSRTHCDRLMDALHVDPTGARGDRIDLGAVDWDALSTLIEEDEAARIRRLEQADFQFYLLRRSV